MKAKSRQSVGLTLPEVVTATAIIAMLLGLAIPSIRAINNSFQSTGAKNVISGALASARATAAQHQRYAGIRFQLDQYGDQYIILIIHDPNATDYANGFRAIEGRKPIKLPQNLAVMDLRTRFDLVDGTINDNIDIAAPAAVTDTTTFSVVFSPSGKLVIHKVRAKRQKTNDDVFNTKNNVTHQTNPVGMFIEDRYVDDGYGEEPSRSSFVIYDKKIFDAIDVDCRWSDYLSKLAQHPVYINPYTGTIIE